MISKRGWKKCSRKVFSNRTKGTSLISQEQNCAFFIKRDKMLVTPNNFPSRFGCRKRRIVGSESSAVKSQKVLLRPNTTAR